MLLLRIRKNWSLQNPAMFRLTWTLFSVLPMRNKIEQKQTIARIEASVAFPFLFRWLKFPSVWHCHSLFIFYVKISPPPPSPFRCLSVSTAYNWIYVSIIQLFPLSLSLSHSLLFNVSPSLSLKAFPYWRLSWQAYQVQLQDLKKIFKYETDQAWARLKEERTIFNFKILITENNFFSGI